MHNDFFLIAATPVVKVFLILVARRKDSCEMPSRPAMDPDKIVVPPARLMNNELITFLQETQYVNQRIHLSNALFDNIQRIDSVSGLLLGVLQEVCSIGGRRILLGVVQPPTDIVLYPVSPMTVAQQEVICLFTLQQ